LKQIRELLVDLYNCKSDLDNADFLVATLKAAAHRMGSKIVKTVSHRYSPTGITVILILAETHISIHTWPEHGYAALDVFVCDEKVDLEAGWLVVKAALQPSSFEVHRLVRRISTDGD
jgi:S-adenosylmethionine decarboxylase